MMNTKQLIQRLQAIEKEVGHPVFVAIEVKEDHLPDISNVSIVTDVGQTEEPIAVIQYEKGL